VKSRDFCYWLQGYFEISGETVLGPEATQKVKNHLNMVFKHEIDPSNGSPEHNKELSKVHNETLVDIAAKIAKDPYSTLALNC
jgi:hypothetical protein